MIVIQIFWVQLVLEILVFYKFYFYSINRRYIYQMELRRSSRYNTAVVPKSVGKKHNTLKATQINMKKEQSSDSNEQKQGFDFKEHEAARFIKKTNPSKTEFKKFATLLYRGLYYSVNNLKGPSEQFIKKKSVNLPEPKNAKKKFLLLDLDQTLIHSVFTTEKTQISFTLKGDEFKFNIRPYCMEFLSKMSELYTIYVYTASTSDYAQPIVQYLNQKKKTIHGVLNRRNCMETHNGFYIKDLRIIKNRQLKDMIIVDNLVHSFGLQIDNGIPILEYLKGKEDKQLMGLQTMLIEMADVDDVRDYLKKNLNLRKVLQIPEDQFINFGEDQRRHKTIKL